jgi:hypothetical protein
MGGMFKQIDLQESECYLLDAGAHLIYLWQGLDSSYQGRALSTRVCRRYCAQLGKEHDICASPRFRSVFPLPVPVPVDGGIAVEIRYVESGSEPPEFCQLFPKWTRAHSDPTTHRVCVEFDPNEITADESLDEKFDKTGRPLDLLPVRKARYSDGSSHSRQPQSQQQPQPSRPQSLQRPDTTSTKDQSESLFKITLRSHDHHLSPAAGGGGGGGGVTGGEASEHVPEFVAKRNALRSVKCPDPIPRESTESKELSSSEAEQPMSSKNTVEVSVSHHRSSTTATTVLSDSETTDPGTPQELTTKHASSPSPSRLAEERTPTTAPMTSTALVRAPVGGAVCCVIM